MTESRRTHWGGIYQTKPAEAVSWHQARPERSLALTEATGLGFDARILDVGGGASRLVDCLLDAGYRQLTVLDISPVALKHAQDRLGERARQLESQAERHLSPGGTEQSFLYHRFCRH